MCPLASPAAHFNLAEVGVILEGLSASDWKLALKIASSYSRGLVDWEASDLLNESVAALLSGDRTWKRDVPVADALAMATVSIARNAGKKARNAPFNPHVEVDVGAGNLEDDDMTRISPPDYRTPETIVGARLQLSRLEALVADDSDAGAVLEVWACELRGMEAAEELGFDKNRYEAARKRLDRKLSSVRT